MRQVQHILKGQTIFCMHNSAWRTATQRVSYWERIESKQELSSLSQGALIKYLLSGWELSFTHRQQESLLIQLFGISWLLRLFYCSWK